MDLHVLGWSARWRDLFEPYRHDHLIPGRIVAEHRDAYRVATESGERAGVIGGRFRFQVARGVDLPAVGDFVAVRVPDGLGPAVVDAVLPRQTVLIRQRVGDRPDDQVIAANVDIVFVMTAFDHDFNVRRIERYLSAVWDSGATPVVLLNKMDLHHAIGERVTEIQRVTLGVTVHALSAQTADGLDALRVYLRPGVTIGIVGSSGVGKSTLLNRLLGHEAQTTAGVRAHDHRGRHTTTSRQLFVVPDGGIVIDTPGMREFQLSESDEGLERAFAEIDALAADCRFSDCAHRQRAGMRRPRRDRWWQARPGPGVGVRQALERAALPGIPRRSVGRSGTETSGSNREPGDQADEGGIIRGRQVAYAWSHPRDVVRRAYRQRRGRERPDGESAHERRGARRGTARSGADYRQHLAGDWFRQHVHDHHVRRQRDRGYLRRRGGAGAPPPAQSQKRGTGEVHHPDARTR